MTGIQPAKNTTLTFPNDVEVSQYEYFVPAILHAARFRRVVNDVPHIIYMPINNMFTSRLLLDLLSKYVLYLMVGYFDD